ncbi:MAG: hypothetical protein ACYDBB_01310 [Armatimonadota bacterium]
MHQQSPQHGPLAVPLSSAQISAAITLQSRMPLWGETNRAFQRLHASMPGFDLSASLLKVAVINQLYYTNVFAIARMAEHVTTIMAIPPDDPLRLVEDIAALPPVPGQQHDRKHWSFASKFVYFFVDDRCPIYDSYAVGMVAYHLGRGRYAWDEDAPFTAFVSHLQQLQQVAGLSCSVGELDTYLWIAGLYRAWSRDTERAQINTEARKLFSEDSAEVKVLLQVLLPSVSPILDAALPS